MSARREKRLRKMEARVAYMDGRVRELERRLMTLEEVAAHPTMILSTEEKARPRGVLASLLLILNLLHSRTGRAVMAVRDNAIAAESIGISITRYKLLAFVVSAVFAGMAGTLYAMNCSTVTAAKFDFNTSILVLVFVVLGGLGNIWGSIIAAALLTVLPELLRAVNDYRMLLYAILLIALMLFNNSKLKERLFSGRHKEVE